MAGWPRWLSTTKGNKGKQEERGPGKVKDKTKTGTDGVVFADEGIPAVLERNGSNSSEMDEAKLQHLGYDILYIVMKFLPCVTLCNLACASRTFRVWTEGFRLKLILKTLDHTNLSRIVANPLFTMEEAMQCIAWWESLHCMGEFAMEQSLYCSRGPGGKYQTRYHSLQIQENVPCGLTSDTTNVSKHFVMRSHGAARGATSFHGWVEMVDSLEDNILRKSIPTEQQCIDAYGMDKWAQMQKFNYSPKFDRRVELKFTGVLFQLDQRSSTKNNDYLEERVKVLESANGRTAEPLGPSDKHNRQIERDDIMARVIRSSSEAASLQYHHPYQVLVKKGFMYVLKGVRRRSVRKIASKCRISIGNGRPIFPLVNTEDPNALVLELDLHNMATMQGMAKAFEKQEC